MTKTMYTHLCLYSKIKKNWFDVRVMPEIMFVKDTFFLPKTK